MEQLTELVEELATETPWLDEEDYDHVQQTTTRTYIVDEVVDCGYYDDQRDSDQLQLDHHRRRYNELEGVHVSHDRGQLQLDRRDRRHRHGVHVS